MQEYSIVFTAAGTGGHVVSALSVISQLKKLLPKEAHESILFVGSTNLRYGQAHKPSIEEKLVTQAGINFVKIRSGKLQRIVNWPTFLRFFKLGAKIPLGFWDAFWLMRKVRPKVVIGFGGYVTPSVILGGKLAGATTAIHEQTIAPGAANKAASFFADTIFITYPQSVQGFSRFVRKRITHVGYPLRDDFFVTKSLEELSEFQQKPKLLEFLQRVSKMHKRVPFILIMGGSSGSHVINLAAAKIVPKLAQKAYVLVLTGEPGYYDDFALMQQVVQTLPKKLQSRVFVEKYLNALPHVLKMVDVVVGRSGAGAVYEFGVLKKPSVLVPLPFTRGGEQKKHAQLLEKIGLGVIVEQSGLFSLDEGLLLDAILERLDKAMCAPEFKTSKKYSSLIKNKRLYKKTFVENAAEKIARWVAQKAGFGDAKRDRYTKSAGSTAR